MKTKLEPLVTRVFLINYSTLAEISKIVKDYLTPERGALQTDERTNSLIVKDTTDSIDRIKKIIETLDTQTPQILIESKIVEATESYSKRIGLTSGIKFGYDPFTANGVASGTGGNTIGTVKGPGFSFASAPGTAAPGVLGMNVAVFKRLIGLDFQLQMMESESKGRIISTPKVVTQNKKLANITSSNQTSFTLSNQVAGAGTAISFQTITSTLNLQVTPQVTNDGAISMDINLQKQSFGTRPAAGAPPDLQTRNVRTNVLVDNGSTIVIGGLYQTSHEEVVEGIPVLKDIPLLGWLFRNPYQPNTTKNELIIFLTPRILNQEEAGFTAKKESTLGIEPGTETKQQL
jgi:type IV pilus assembly protein PilQ